MSKAEHNYTVTKRVMLTLVYFMRYFRHYLYGWKFAVRTDHGALQRLASSEEPSEQVVRWLEQLAEFTYKVQHRPGKKHRNADALSRKPQVRGGTEEKVPTVSAVSCSGTGCFPEQWMSGDLDDRQREDSEFQGASQAVRSLWSQWDQLE